MFRLGGKPWNAGTGKGWENRDGYIEVCWNGKHVFQHRLRAEQYLGRPLLSCERIHHRDGDRRNNALENLQLIDPGTHATLTNLNRKYKQGYSLDLSPEERKARAERMKAAHLKYPHIRAGLKKGKGVFIAQGLFSEEVNDV